MTQDFITKVRIQLAMHKKSQAWLANMLGVSEAYVSDIMNGKRSPEKQVPKIEIILAELEKSN